jgi:hypothetical protein
LELAPVELHAAGILAALAAAALAAHCAGGRAALLVLLGGFAGAAFAFARLGSPDVATLGLCVAGAAITALARPQWRLLPPLAGGICGAAWISVLEAQGLPWLPAAVLAICVLAASAALAARRRGFASTELRDEALVLVASFALLLGIGPDVVDGWRSAVALKAEPLAAAGPHVDLRLGALVVGSVLLGGVYTVWKRR